MMRTVDKRDVKYGILVTGRGLHGEPIREYKPLVRGVPALLALQHYEAIPTRNLKMIVNDLTTELERRSEEE